MGSLQQIQAAAQSIIEICQKDLATKADKEKLLKLQGEIFTGIENLVECEICGSITDLIVTMTLAEVTAKVCTPCGIHALEVGKIQRRTVRRRSKKKTGSTTVPAKATTEKPKKKVESTSQPSNAATAAKSKKRMESSMALPKAAPTARKASTNSSTDTVELYEEVEKQTGLKKTEIKRLHKMIEEIASPMNLEHTVLYITHEAGLAKLKIEPEVLGEAVKLLMDK